jgi:hypothetical protein
MNKLAPSTPWYAPWRSRVTSEDDPADLGTAFGLDLSLQAAPTPMPATQATPREGWVRRWAARRKLPPT